MLRKMRSANASHVISVQAHPHHPIKSASTPSQTGMNSIRATHSIRALDFQSNGLQPKTWTTFRCRALARAMPTIAFMEPGAWPVTRGD
ncbi:hypothetical protein BDQ94DRAFT_132816 [Aspergillus welwitschiae]|uniref:Uncharacterized protein n=1 Tax=Aspergillus welwitschiae TaxID=1341132 RepID=A0A3F3QKB2_9EURO|nr:hypothetical protein BDQ94DRAFT_132816 [Aspergillus welwitschiae]RDH39292.1 hypothetical protein BDQ94DRAFT_132816 [Aspergillus welwitschiae]